MSKFAGLRKATLGPSRYPYLEPEQKYKLRLTKTYVIETRDKGDAFIAEFDILESTSPNLKPGTKASFYQGMVKKDTAFGSIKGLTYAVLGLDPEKTADAKKIAEEVDPVIEAELDRAIETNHMAGATLGCQTVTRVSKTTGKPYTAHNWLPASA